jgi:hypothetical protein
MAPTFIQASWTSVQLETLSWSALHQGFYTTICPVSTTSALVHFTIPSPVIVDNNHLCATLASLHLTTGSTAHIGVFHVYESKRKTLELNGMNIWGLLQFVQFPIPDRPEALWGAGINILIVCNAINPDVWVQFVSAGTNFQSA